jgi:hypothetical protein
MNEFNRSEKWNAELLDFLTLVNQPFLMH